MGTQNVQIIGDNILMIFLFEILIDLYNIF